MVMDVAGQVFTLGGVVVGALASYLVTSLNERSRYIREVAKRWEERKFDAYAAYVSDVKQQVVVANRTSATLGLHNRVTSPLMPEEGLPLLAEQVTRRTTSSERATLLAGEATLVAIRRLNDAAWQMECFARDVVENATTSSWEQAFRAYHEALDAFHRCARAELGVPGRLVDRPVEYAYSKPMGGLVETNADGQASQN
jgi:hypothetical protein